MPAFRIVLLLGFLAVQAAAADKKPEAGSAANVDNISDCKLILGALRLNYQGNTVFCPVNKAIAEFAKAVGFESVQALLAELPDTNSNSSKRAMIERVFKYHIIVGFAPRKGFRSGGYATLLTPEEKDSTLIADVTVRDGIKLTAKYEKDLTAVSAVDLTFEGPLLLGGSSSYVVHALPKVILPASITLPQADQANTNSQNQADTQATTGSSSPDDGASSSAVAAGAGDDQNQDSGASQKSHGKGFGKSFFIPFAALQSAAASFSAAAGFKGFFNGRTGESISAPSSSAGVRRLLLR